VIIAIVVLAVVLIGVVGVSLLSRRRHSKLSGVDNFRRHIDALSPESRREVMDRVRRSQDEQKPES
jgi:hypothetical protein